MKIRSLALLLMCCCAVLAVRGQMVDPVHFTSELRIVGDNKGEIVFTGTIDSGWHVYSTDIGSGGPIAATFHADRLEGVETAGRLQPRGKVISQYDKLFEMDVRYFEHQVTFVQPVRFTRQQYQIDCYLEYGACNDEMCLPPTSVELKTSGTLPTPVDQTADTDSKQQTADTDSKDDALGVPDGSAAGSDTTAVPASTALSAELADTAATTAAPNDALQTSSSTSWWFIFLQGFLGGLIALFTPCVWPVIPMTVSFFLKRNKSRAKAIREAITYGLSIIVIYVLLGLLVTLLFGASALNALSTNAVFNIFFCLLLVVFAASFFGAFEITLPASWANSADRKSESASGWLSIFLMAFTLALVSFSCTGPIIGFLLVAVSTQGSIAAPAIGMTGFAVALALPFTLFALFPQLLKSAPKSGGWMNAVKVTLAFIELAFALKFLSVADLAYGWHLLDREVFLAIWIVLFTLLGCYHLGWLRFPADDDSRHTSVPRFFIAVASLAFAVYMVPGLWGAPLKAISAFAPPMTTQDFKLSSDTSMLVEPRTLDYDTALSIARAEGKPVMIDFTGFGCVNCRKMEAAVWTDSRVADLLNNRYVLVSLYVDDKTPLVSPVTVTENGATRTLRTVGDKWSYLQRSQFGANAQPFYVLISPDGKLLAEPRSYDEDIDAYLQFLHQGLQ